MKPWIAFILRLPLMAWRWLHWKRADIRYHSATRQSTRWNRAMDFAPLLALLLAPVAVILADDKVSSSAPPDSLFGVLQVNAAGEIVAMLTDEEARRINTPGLEHVGQFNVSASNTHHGFPVTSSVVSDPPRVEVNLINDPRAMIGLGIDLTDQYHAAIAEAIAEEAPAGSLIDPTRVATEKNIWVLGAAASAIIWWIVLSLAMMLLIRMLHINHEVHGAKRAIRRKLRGYDNKCVECGYDLTGLEFNERCPECGGLVM